MTVHGIQVTSPPLFFYSIELRFEFNYAFPLKYFCIIKWAVS